MQPNLDRNNRRPPDYHMPCPACGPKCHTAANRKKKTVGVWEDKKGGRRTWCIRCGHKDRDRHHAPQARQPARPKQKDTSRTANWLWSQSQPLKGTLGERYLRDARGLDLKSLPATMRFLEARGSHPASIVTAFGLAEGTEPSDLTLELRVTALHLTRLDEHANKIGKMMLGAVSGQPLCVAPTNDACGLSITEGIEDALSVHLATGLGAWAAGSATHMPKLAQCVPTWVESITIVADSDQTGLRNAKRLHDSLKELGFEVRLTQLTGPSS